MGEGKGEKVKGERDGKDDKGKWRKEKGRLLRGERKEDRRESGDLEGEKGAVTGRNIPSRKNFKVSSKM